MQRNNSPTQISLWKAAMIFGLAERHREKADYDLFKSAVIIHSKLNAGGYSSWAIESWQDITDRFEQYLKENNITEKRGHVSENMSQE